MISIITPIYNAQWFIGETYASLLAQYETNWEWILVNDGSTDSTRDIVHTFDDPRVRYFEQDNKGVSASRNLGLAQMKGDFFCFLDADDLMPPASLASRLALFDNQPDCAFVGGAQEQRNVDLSIVLRVQTPTYIGDPRKGLIRLDQGCFINCGTWLIKRDRSRQYTFPDHMRHSEDLAFFLSISDQGILAYTNEIAQVYRRHESAMSDLDGLWKGYTQYYDFACAGGYLHTEDEKHYLQGKIKSIMFKSFARAMHLSGVIRVMTFQFK